MRISLSELDRRWDHIKAGKTYHGEAVAPRNTSWFERMIGICRVRFHIEAISPAPAAPHQPPCLLPVLACLQGRPEWLHASHACSCRATP